MLYISSQPKQCYLKINFLCHYRANEGSYLEGLKNKESKIHTRQMLGTIRGCDFSIRLD